MADQRKSAKAGTGSVKAGTGPLAPGVILQNRYVVERLIGGGGMGMVYLARDQRLANRTCAIKEMVDHFIDPQQRLEANEYFAREADTLAQLRHPSIPAVTDRFDDQNRHYLVMEYVEGRNLEEEMAATGAPLSEGLAIEVARQLCDVLAYLHSLAPPIVYRDMKPSNVMLTAKGKVMLVDFGIARLFQPSRKGTMIGTLGFAPPEQYQGAVDPRSDIYSLGATLHFVLTNRDPEKFPPFSFPPARELRPDVSSNLAGAIDRALAYDAEDRPQTIDEFREMMLYGRGLSDAGAPRVSSKSGTAGLAPLAIAGAEAPVALRPPRSAVRQALSLSAFLVVLATIAFSATYIYSNPDLQGQLGIRSFINQLPWRHEELLAAAREHPLDFKSVTLALSARDGSPLSPPKASFTDTELSNARYLKWEASFGNRLAGLEARSDKIEARFYDPNGLQVAESDAERFVGPKETTVDFEGVALIPDLSDHPHGDYKIALYTGDQVLVQQRFTVVEDEAAKAKAAADKAAAAARALEEEQKKAEEAKRLAMIEARKRDPLSLAGIKLLNTTRTGTALSRASESFDAAKLLFVGWEVSFQNRLYRLESNQYRVDAAYIAPDGRTLGSVYDTRMIPEGAPSAIFSGRIGNSQGGAFVPGTYTVNFYLNGQFLAERRFRVTAPGGAPEFGDAGSSFGPGATTAALDLPTLANGSIAGLAGKDRISIELRLRPQANGFLHGELVIKEPGYGVGPIEGYVRGNHLSFQVSYGSEVLYFEGNRSSDRIKGTFQSIPSRDQGTWSAQAS